MANPKIGLPIYSLLKKSRRWCADVLTIMLVSFHFYLGRGWMIRYESLGIYIAWVAREAKRQMRIEATLYPAWMVKFWNQCHILRHWIALSALFQALCLPCSNLSTIDQAV